MALTKQLKYKDSSGNEQLIEIGVDAKNVESNTFSQATARANLASGDKLPTIFGKLMKWFADLKTVAWTGSYNDLTNKPTMGGITGTVAVTQGGTGATTASQARVNLGVGAAGTYSVANNCTTTAAGYALDARQGKALMDKANQISSDLSARLPGGTGIQWDGANFWGTTAAGVKKKLGDCQKLKTIEVKINSTWGGGSVNTILLIHVIYNGDNITSVTGEVKWNSDGPNTAKVNSFTVY